MQSFEDIKIDDIYKHFDMDLNNIYSLCNSEMGLQQSKRDQIIAFYIAIISFLVPAIIDLKMPFIPQAIAYFLLWVIGITLCSVVRRYRVYKEVYWLTLRTITTLMRVEKDRLNEKIIRFLFWTTMKKMQPKAVASQARDEKGNWLDVEATRKMHSSSAEFLLYRLLSVMTSVVLLISIYTLLYGILLPFAEVMTENFVIVFSAVVACVPSFLSHRHCIVKFIKELAAVYQYCFDNNLASFEKTYDKAWFLHSSIEEQNNH